MNSIGHNIKKYRERLGLTQFHLAMELGISQSAYAQIESGITKISIERALQISKLFMLDLNELINQPKNKVPENTLNDIEDLRLTIIEQKITALQNDVSNLLEQINLFIEKLDYK